MRGWILENSEVGKEKIESRIDETASRMGFVKASDLDNLLARISDLESRLPDSKSKVKKAPEKSGKSVSKSSQKPIKKTIKKSSVGARKKIASERLKG